MKLINIPVENMSTEQFLDSIFDAHKIFIRNSLEAQIKLYDPNSKYNEMVKEYINKYENLKKGNNMKLKFKKLNPHAILPSKANKTDAGFDITAIDISEDENGNDVYSTGLAVEIPDGYVGLIFPRSSICKKGQILTNHVGVIDSGYRGEILLKFKKIILRSESYTYFERIGQLLIIKLDDFEPAFVDELNQTNDRGGGFGSSGQ